MLDVESVVITPTVSFSHFLIEKDLNLSLSTSKSDKTEGENQLSRVSVGRFVRLIGTREDYSWMGDRLWKD